MPIVLISLAIYIYKVGKGVLRMPIDKEQIIDIFNPNDIKYWCKKFKCDKEDLIDAVLTIGRTPKLVSDFLELNRKKRK